MSNLLINIGFCETWTALVSLSALSCFFRFIRCSYLFSMKLEQEVLRNQNQDIINENLALKKTNQQLKNALNLKLYKNAHQVAL